MADVPAIREADDTIMQDRLNKMGVFLSDWSDKISKYSMKLGLNKLELLKNLI